MTSVNGVTAFENLRRHLPAVLFNRLLCPRKSLNTFLTPLPCFLLSSFSVSFSSLGCKPHAAVWSLFSATSVFCHRAYADAHCPQWPVFLAYPSPQAATFPVFLVFAFAASQDNHFPLRFMKASQILSPKATLLKQSIPP